ncbi:HhH-GPD family protein [Oceanithermus profundus DSM 14977]|uniref:Adenine DNA glycosylase n=1 Tax=Oceanithermus profundus (strain DSM 14977 / NBRC 100410 / VKM B-2274 / 506) TaxID=670487 RepID=E4U6D4_OCEP5|nr:HhH-GPD family protein [Oceanithermus profundus DSM 14977]
MEVRGREITNALLRWGEKNLRDFPWRGTRDPYRIFVAEFLLQRTRAEQVVPAYEELVRKYPGFEELAGADPSGLLEIIRPLGLHRRANLLQNAARIIKEQFGGLLPPSMKELTSIEGVGTYTAAAILAALYDLPAPAVDTNTLRVLGRVFGLEIKESSRKKREYRDLIESLVPKGQARLYIYALLDLAATVCTPRNPACDRCPLIRICHKGGGNGL